MLDQEPDKYLEISPWGRLLERLREDDGCVESSLAEAPALG
jgi:hypothetical protein